MGWELDSCCQDGVMFSFDVEDDFLEFVMLMVMQVGYVLFLLFQEFFEVVFFNIGGVYFIICLFILWCYEDIMLVVMFSGWYYIFMDFEGCYFID